MRYKYEFEAPEEFEPGQCEDCPLHYEEYIEFWDEGWVTHCVLGANPEECPLEALRIQCNGNVIIVNSRPDGRDRAKKALERFERAHRK